MVNVCVVPGCTNRSDREKDLSYYSVPLKNEKLLKVWVHKIRRKNLPLNKNSRVCSDHFKPGAKGQRLLPDEYPTLKLPEITAPVRENRPATERVHLTLSEEADSEQPVEAEDDEDDEKKDIGVQVDDERIEHLEAEIEVLKLKLRRSELCLSNIAHSNSKVQFYTGFRDYSTLMAVYKMLGPAVDCLKYWGSEIKGDVKSIQGRNCSLPHTDEYFMVMVLHGLNLGFLSKTLLNASVYLFLLSHAFVSHGLTFFT